MKLHAVYLYSYRYRSSSYKKQQHKIMADRELNGVVDDDDEVSFTVTSTKLTLMTV